MLTFLSEIHFWCLQDDMSIKDTDYGAFKFYDRKDNVLNEHSCSKKIYTEKRHYMWNLTNKRPKKLKDKLKELEDLISRHRIVFCKWLDSSSFQLMLSTGILIKILVDTYTGEPREITFDRYLVGKLHSEYISDVVVAKLNILCTYDDNQITIVSFVKASLDQQNKSEKILRLEPKVHSVELAGPTGRKLERKISCNVNEDKVLVWWRCTREEVYPWSPLVKDQDRANIHIYNLSGLKLQLLCYRRTEFDPIGICFSAVHENVIHCIEQKVSAKGVVTVETCTYEILGNKLHQVAITSIPLQTHVCCHSFSPDSEKLMLGCIDGSIVLFDQGRGVTHLVKAAFIPTIISWHLDGAVVLIANEKGQMQYFDMSLGCIKSQMSSEDVASSSIVVDVASYFSTQPQLIQMIWNKKAQEPIHSRYIQTDGLLLLLFEHGPFAVLRLFASTGAPGLTVDVLVSRYVLENQIDRALGMILCLNWDKYGSSCLVSLQTIIGHLFKQRLTPDIEGICWMNIMSDCQSINSISAQIQRALGSFYAPLEPINDSTNTEFGEQVKDLTRKFFHLLVRYRLYEKAFSLAIDVNDYDLFMDLYYCGQMLKNAEMANAALGRAKDLIQRSNSSNSNHSLCSHSSCSQCSNTNNLWNQEDNIATSYPPLPVPLVVASVYAPPLPTVPVSDRKHVSTFYHSNLPHQHKRVVHPQYSCSSSATSSSVQNATIDTDCMHIQRQQQPHHVHSETAINTTKVDHLFKFKTPMTEIHDLFPPPKLFHMYGTDNNAASSSIPNSSIPKEIIHKTVSMNIPPIPSFVINSSYKTTPALIRTIAPLKLSVPLQCGTTTTTSLNKTTAGEKNVKFSDTVTAFIVPEIPRNDKPLSTIKVKRLNSHYLTNPKQELADSLPLCHPNDEYLKDFTPITTNAESDCESGTKIKVVHFGMV